MIRKLVVVFLTALVLGLALSALDPVTLEVGERALFGWWSFATRVLPQATVTWLGVLTGGICLVLFTCGLHVFLRWLHGELRGEGEQRWRPRWTGAIVIGVVVMFAAGLAATGIVHQVGWLMRSRETWLEPRSLKVPRVGALPSAYNLGEIGHAVMGVSLSRDHLPLNRFDDQGRAIHSWMTALLPYMSATPKGIDLDIGWDDPANSAHFRGFVPEFLNPDVSTIRDARGYALSHYGGNVHVVGQRRPLSLDEVTNGAANTIVAGEAAKRFKAWGDPANLRDPSRGINQDPEGFGGPSGAGAQVLFLDGSVRYLGRATSPKVLQGLSFPRPPG